MSCLAHITYYLVLKLEMEDNSKILYFMAFGLQAGLTVKSFTNMQKSFY